MNADTISILDQVGCATGTKSNITIANVGLLRKLRQRFARAQPPKK